MENANCCLQKTREQRKASRMRGKMVAQHVKGIDVNVQLNSQKYKEQQQNQTALRVIIKAVRYLSQQGISLRGHIDESGIRRIRH